MSLVNNNAGFPPQLQAATPIPQQLPKTQADWQRFVNAMAQRNQPPAWQALSLKNGWSIFAATPEPQPAFQIDASARISCRGMIKGGTTTDGTILATLPYAPSEIVNTVAFAYNGSTLSPCQLSVDTSGNILVVYAGAFSGTYYLSLDQLNFSLSP